MLPSDPRIFYKLLTIDGGDAQQLKKRRKKQSYLSSCVVYLVILDSKSSKDVNNQQPRGISGDDRYFAGEKGNGSGN